MAEKRMLSNKVVDTDLFLDMPATTQKSILSSKFKSR